MSRVEAGWLRRSSGFKILIWSIALGAVGVAPLLLYIGFGPADGNPIGLGLLAVLAGPVGAFGAGIGMIVMLVEYFARGRG